LFHKLQVWLIRVSQSYKNRGLNISGERDNWEQKPEKTNSFTENMLSTDDEKIFPEGIWLF